MGLQVAGGAVPIPVPAPPAPTPGPGIANPPGGGEVIPFPGGRDRPTDRPERPGSRDRPESCPEPDQDPQCVTTGLAGFSAIGPYGGLLTCQYRCPRKGIQHLNQQLTFTPAANPQWLCKPTVPESIFR